MYKMYNTSRVLQYFHTGRNIVNVDCVSPTANIGIPRTKNRCVPDNSIASSLSPAPSPAPSTLKKLKFHPEVHSFQNMGTNAIASQPQYYWGLIRPSISTPIIVLDCAVFTHNEVHAAVTAATTLYNYLIQEKHAAIKHVLCIVNTTICLCSK